MAINIWDKPVGSFNLVLDRSALVYWPFWTEQSRFSYGRLHKNLAALWLYF